LSQILLDDEKEKDEQLLAWRAKNMKKKNDRQLVKLQQLDKKRGEKTQVRTPPITRTKKNIYRTKFNNSPSSIY